MPYYIRLDDACEKMDVKNWARMEEILDRYRIAPLVGIIPHCEDPKMETYPVDPAFWEKVAGWVKGWYNDKIRIVCNCLKILFFVTDRHRTCFGERISAYDKQYINLCLIKRILPERSHCVLLSSPAHIFIRSCQE